MMQSLTAIVLLFSVAVTVTAWQQPQPKAATTTVVNRRRALEGLATAVVFLPSINVAQAQPTEFQNIGTQSPMPTGDDSAQFTTLANGVKIKDFLVGAAGSDVVGAGSRVDIQCSGRLLNLNGVIFYNTKNNNPDGFGAVPLTITLGKGEAIPGLEAGVVGMRKNGIRRIIIPAELAYSKYPDLEPKPTSELDQRALDSVVKNPRRDATILFDVRVERLK